METPEQSVLWARLRADLNNLGSHYGPLPAPVLSQPSGSEPVERFGRAAWDRPVTFDSRVGWRGGPIDE